MVYFEELWERLTAWLLEVCSCYFSCFSLMLLLLLMLTQGGDGRGVVRGQPGHHILHIRLYLVSGGVHHMVHQTPGVAPAIPPCV